MKYNTLTPYELAEQTIKDINRKRQLKKDGERQAFKHCMENRDRIRKRISHGR